MAIRKQERLRHRSDFDAVFKRGRSWNSRLLVLRTLENDLPHNRYGFVTSKRVGNAVVRNRVRRRLSESVRQLAITEGWDVVFSSKAAAAEATYEEINRAVVDLLAKAGLLKDGKTPQGASL